MKITKYLDLSDKNQILEIPSGIALKDCFKNIDWEKFVIFANGVKVDENYKCDEHDFIIIRQVPGSTAVAIVIAVVAIGIAVYAGVKGYQANKEAEKARKEIEKLKQQTNDDVINLPFLKGATNSVATGKTQPYIIGTHLFTPYILNSGGNYKGYSTISGNNGEQQFYNVVLEGGFNRQALSRLYCDDITLRNFDGQTAQEGIYSFQDNSIFAGQNSFIEIAQDGQPFETNEFNKKIVETIVQQQLYKLPQNESQDGTDEDNHEPLYFTLEKNSCGADVCIMFNGLFHYTDNGTKGNKTRTINAYYSLDYNRLVAEGDDNAEKNAHWQLFPFQKAKYHEPIKVIHQGFYNFTVNMTTNEHLKKDKIIVNNIYNWVLKSGEDIRNSYDWYNVQSEERIGGGMGYTTYRYTIQLYKEEWTKEYYTEPEDTNTFTGKFNKQIRYNAHIDFNYNEVKDLAYPITIKVDTPDRETTEGKDCDDCYIEYIHSYLYNPTKSKELGDFVDERIIEEREARMSTLIGLHIESTTNNEDKLKSIQVVTSGMARIWDGEEWSKEKQVTSNVASWLLEVLTTDAHTPSQLDDSEIDLESFGELYELCEEKGYYVNYVLTNGMQKSAVLEMLCNLAHCVMYRSIYGKIAIATDEIKEQAQFILNEQNLINFSYEKDIQRQPDGVAIKYISAKDEYQEDSIIVMYDGTLNPSDREPTTILTELQADGITDFEQAYKYALYKMRCVKMRPHTVTAQIGKEGFYFVPMSKIFVQHPSLKIGLGSTEIQEVIKENNYITKLKLYDAIELNTTDEFNIIVECATSNYCTPRSYKIKGFDGYTDIIELETPIYVTTQIKPNIHNILSYGNKVETITKPMILTEVSPNENGFILTLIDYDERIFNDDFEIPDYESNISIKGKPLNELPKELPSKIIDQVAQITDEKIGNIALSPNVYTNISACGIAVNDNDEVTIDQEVTIEFFVKQGEDDLQFLFNVDAFDFDFEYQIIDVNKLKLFIPKGTIITTEELKIPLLYTAYKFNFTYADGEGYEYSDGRQDETGNNLVYGVRLEENYKTTYNVGFTLIGVQGGRYLGAWKNSDLKNFENLIIGDYFVWIGEDLQSPYSSDGATANANGWFRKSQLYTFNGIRGNDYKNIFSRDTMREHIGGSLTDALSVANSSLNANNSNVVEFLDHLTANSIFVDKLVANTAFIEKLFAHRIKLEDITENGETEHGAIYGGERYNADGTINEESTEENQGFHLSSDGFLQANNAIIEGAIKTSDFYIHNVKQGDFYIGTIFKNINLKLEPNYSMACYTYDHKIKLFIFAPGKYKLHSYGVKIDISIIRGIFQFIKPLKMEIWGYYRHSSSTQKCSPIILGETNVSYTESFSLEYYLPDEILNIGNDDIYLEISLFGIFSTIGINNDTPHTNLTITPNGYLCIDKENSILSSLTMSTTQHEVEFLEV